MTCRVLFWIAANKRDYAFDSTAMSLNSRMADIYAGVENSNLDPFFFTPPEDTIAEKQALKF